MRAANHFFYAQGFHVVDTTDKPIETSAEEIVSLITRRKVATLEEATVTTGETGERLADFACSQLTIRHLPGICP
jgi:hypothetical protein